FAVVMLIMKSIPLADINVLAQPEKNLLAVIKDGRICMSKWRKLDQDVYDPTTYLE
ncbi:amidohydrolase, partial [Calycina marina]